MPPIAQKQEPPMNLDAGMIGIISLAALIVLLSST